MPRPQIIREYFAGCSEDICWFFLCFFDKRQRERALSDRKKNSVKHQQFKDLVICFSREFLKNLLARLLSQLFLPQTLWFFFKTGVLVVWIFCFSFAQRLLETRLFLFSPKRGKTIRRWHWEPQLLAHRVAEKKNIFSKYSLDWVISNLSVQRLKYGSFKKLFL